MDVSYVISQRGDHIWTFVEILIELNLFGYQRFTELDEENIIRANFVHLCAETSPERLLGADAK